MKKVIMFAALLCCALSGFAEKKPIRIEIDERPLERTEIQLPTVSIEEDLLTIEFPSSTTFSVSIVSKAGEVVYSGTYSAEMAILTLSNLSAGEYTLVIKDGSHAYSGEFQKR